LATISLEVKDLDALDEACKRLGLELVRGQETYKWFGSLGNNKLEPSEKPGHYNVVADCGDGRVYRFEFELPPGFKIEDLGRSCHVIRVPGSNGYEIGVVRRRDGRPGFILQADYDVNEGGAIGGIVGEGCRKLKQMYATTVAIKQARQSGFRVTEQKLPNGSIQLRMSR
jgi:hypothetical protein